MLQLNRNEMFDIQRTTFDVRIINHKELRAMHTSVARPPGLRKIEKTERAPTPCFLENSAGLDPLVRDFLRTRNVAQTT